MYVEHYSLWWLYIIHSIFPHCTVFVGSHCLQMFMLMKLLASVKKKKIINRTSNSKDYITKWSDTLPLKHMFTKKSDNILDTCKCHINFISNEYEKYVMRMLCSENTNFDYKNRWVFLHVHYTGTSHVTISENNIFQIQGGSNMTGTDVCKQAALRSSCATLREWSHNLHPPSCSG